MRRCRHTGDGVFVAKKKKCDLGGDRDVKISGEQVLYFHMRSSCEQIPPDVEIFNSCEQTPPEVDRHRFDDWCCRWYCHFGGDGDVLSGSRRIISPPGPEQQHVFNSCQQITPDVDRHRFDDWCCCRWYSHLFLKSR